MRTVKLICLPLLLILTSCGYYGADNEPLYASSMGFSLEDGIYTAAVYGDHVTPEKSTSSVFTSGCGADPVSAIEAAGKSIGRDVFFGHCTAIVLDRNAASDKRFYITFAESVISPACMVYYSDHPAEAAENIAADGFSEKLFRAAADCIDNVPVTLPCADDSSRAAVICGNSVSVLSHDDSYGLMLLCGKEYPLSLTERLPGGTYREIKTTPSVSRSAGSDGGTAVLYLSIRLKNGGAAAEDYVEKVCRSAFERTVSAGKDAPKVCRLAGKDELPDNAELVIEIY